jgi:hypothetical protein
MHGETFMSEARTDTTEDRAAQAASGSRHGRHRGPASSDTDASNGTTGHGKHRRPTHGQDTAAAS